MKLNIYHQERYSRSELILRSIFGFFYIVLPHGFLLFFMAIWSAILNFLTFWIILFTGKYPESFFEYQVKYLRWSWRLNARVLNLADGYPAFGLDGTDDYTDFEIPYKEQSDRISVLLRAVFGFFYVLIPHLFVLYFLALISGILVFFAWWVVLFTGKYPVDMFNFILKTQRWGTRVNLYMMYMTDVYPPFSLDPDMTPYYEESGIAAVDHNDDIADDDWREDESDNNEADQPKKDDLV